MKGMSRVAAALKRWLLLAHTRFRNACALIQRTGSWKGWALFLCRLTSVPPSSSPEQSRSPKDTAGSSLRGRDASNKAGQATSLNSRDASRGEPLSDEGSSMFDEGLVDDEVFQKLICLSPERWARGGLGNSHLVRIPVLYVPFLLRSAPRNGTGSG